MYSGNKIVETADGSLTIFVPGLEEHYHSVNGAIQEANTVFIRPWTELLNQKKIKILEIGFGTGLNALLTALQSIELELEINYTTLEKYPLEKDFWDKLNYHKQCKGESKNLFKKIHRAEWEKEVRINKQFIINKQCIDIKKFHSPPNYDIIYFDAFARSKQPAMWSNDIIFNISNMCITGGLFLTYAATGELKRQLKTCNYKVERLPGPIGKREITRAIKLS